MKSFVSSLSKKGDREKFKLWYIELQDTEEPIPVQVVRNKILEIVGCTEDELLEKEKEKEKEQKKDSGEILPRVLSSSSKLSLSGRSSGAFEIKRNDSPTLGRSSPPNSRTPSGYSSNSNSAILTTSSDSPTNPDDSNHNHNNTNNHSPSTNNTDNNNNNATKLNGSEKKKKHTSDIVITNNNVSNQFGSPSNTQNGLKDNPPPVKKDRLEHLREEFIQTEETYLKGLHTACEIYLAGVREHGLINEKDIEVIFLNIETLFQIHQKLLSDLLRTEHAKKDGGFDALTSLLNAFRYFVPFLKMYTLYVNGFDDSTKKLDKLRASPFSSKLKAFLEECKNRPESQKLPIDAYLIMPIQRLPRYELLLRDLLQAIDEKERQEEHKKLEELLSTVQEVNSHVNESKKQQERRNKLYKIQTAVKSKGVDLFNRVDRRLVLEQAVDTIEIKEGEEYLFAHREQDAIVFTNHTTLFLFDDLLLELNATYAKGKEEPQRYKLLRNYPLRNLDIKQTLSKLIPDGVEVAFISKEEEEAMKREWEKQYEETKAKFLAQAMMTTSATTNIPATTNNPATKTPSTTTTPAPSTTATTTTTTPTSSVPITNSGAPMNAFAALRAQFEASNNSGGGGGGAQPTTNAGPKAGQGPATAVGASATRAAGTGAGGGGTGDAKKEGECGGSSVASEDDSGIKKKIELTKDISNTSMFVLVDTLSNREILVQLPSMEDKEKWIEEIKKAKEFNLTLPGNLYIVTDDEKKTPETLGQGKQRKNLNKRATTYLAKKKKKIENRRTSAYYQTKGSIVPPTKRLPAAPSAILDSPDSPPPLAGPEADLKLSSKALSRNISLKGKGSGSKRRKDKKKKKKAKKVAQEFTITKI